MGIFLAVMSGAALVWCLATALALALPDDRFDDLDENDTGTED